MSVQYKLWSVLERPDLLDAAEALSKVSYPLYMQHDTVSLTCWDALLGEHLGRYQTIATDGTDAVVAYGNAIPFEWLDGADLPDEGWDAVLREGAADSSGLRRANALSALSIAVDAGHRGSGLADLMLGAMKDGARANGLKALIAPVRPTRKSHYPLQSFDEYCAWKTPDGAPFDPWVRKHWRQGAKILKSAPRSMTIPGTISQWQEWTGLISVTGTYAFPGGLSPLAVDVEGDRAVYVEPNLWMQHQL